MSQPFVGEIRMVGFNFNPRGWALCNGQLLPINQNAALFSLLGTTYGGNGTTTFQLPDLRSRVPVHSGNGSAGPGLQPVDLGEAGGSESITLTQSQLPTHTHIATYNPAGGTALAVAVAAAAAQATAASPVGNIPGQAEVPSRTAPTQVNSYAAPSAATGTLGGVTLTGTGAITVGAAGSSLPVDTAPPYLGVNFVIALQGIFPSRN